MVKPTWHSEENVEDFDIKVNLKFDDSVHFPMQLYL
jgi:hypothetical protein